MEQVYFLLGYLAVYFVLYSLSYWFVHHYLPERAAGRNPLPWVQYIHPIRLIRSLKHYLQGFPDSKAEEVKRQLLGFRANLCEPYTAAKQHERELLAERTQISSQLSAFMTEKTDLNAKLFSAYDIDETARGMYDRGWRALEEHKPPGLTLFNFIAPNIIFNFDGRMVKLNVQTGLIEGEGLPKWPAEAQIALLQLVAKGDLVSVATMISRSLPKIGGR